MDNQKIGEFIKKKRKEKGLTQQALGDLVGVSFKAVSKWECGNSIPDISILKKVCEILEISIEELLDAKDKTKIETQKKKKIIMPSITILSIIIITIIGLNITKKDTKSDETKKITNKYECILTKTYNIDNINESNDENYLYVTFKEYQVEGVHTIKLSKTISKDLKIGENYEFTFNTHKNYISETPDIVFENSELINIEHSDKIGIEQKNESNCK